MACNTCAKPFTLLRKEKGCPGCGFSYCSKCLANEVYLKKLNKNAKVCAKCKTLMTTNMQNTENVQPPDAYLKRIEKLNENKGYDNSLQSTSNFDPKDHEILARLQKLKESHEPIAGTSNEDIERRIKNLKGEIKTATDEELRNRLDKLSGYRTRSNQNTVQIFSQNTKSEQEQADELMKQYMEQANIDKTYKHEFDEQINDMMSRLEKLKGERTDSKPEVKENSSEDEEDSVRKIIEKLKAESFEQQESSEFSERNDELPFCEICNEDACRRCLGCKYLFCKRCFEEHKDDDDDCNQYENYTPPKSKSMY